MSQERDKQEANKRAAQQVFDVWDGNDIEELDDIIAEDVVLNAPKPVGTVHGREAYKNNLRMLRAGILDFSFEVHDIIAEGETVMAHCTLGGTHEGELMGIEPTGTPVEVRWLGSYRFNDGKIVEVTGQPDLFGAFLQIGAIDPPGIPSTEAENKEIVRKYPEAVVSEGNLAVIDEIFTEDHVQHTSAASENLHGRAAVKENVSMLREAFPDTECIVQDLIAEGDMVVRRDRATGTHKGEFNGIPPTGKEIVIQGIHIHRIEDGQIIETWSQGDRLGAMQQLGVMESPGA